MRGACFEPQQFRLFFYRAPPTRAVVARDAPFEVPSAMKLARQLLTTSQKPGVCLVVGAGAGIGAHVARRFALSGMTAVLCRRTNQEGLDAAVRAIEDEGGRAKGYLLNAVTPGSIEAIVEEVEASLGAIEACPSTLTRCSLRCRPASLCSRGCNPWCYSTNSSPPPSTTHASAGGCLQPGRADR